MLFLFKRLMASLLSMFRQVATTYYTNTKTKQTFLLKYTLVAIVLIICLFYYFIDFNFYPDTFNFDNYECQTHSSFALKNFALDEYEYSNNDKENRNQIKMCLNKVTYQNEVAVWSLLSDDHLKYAVGAVKLLKSLENNVAKKTFDANIMELIEKPIEARARRFLLRAGWRICQVRRIAPRDESNTYGRFRDQFTKVILVFNI